jgi:hypothetical protein
MFRARRHIVLVASALLLAAAIPRAQSDSAEAIDAFSRGDYQRAAEIFNVLAIKSARPDHAAEFFLAMMYENGLGVPADPIRACALYVRASTGSGMALRRASEHLLDALRRTLSQDVFEDCVLYASIGFGHRFRPETFFLEPGHSISWDLKGATITYGGKDTRITEPLTAPGGVFLPIQHTELEVGPSRSARRHFIEVFLWLPKNDKQDWTLLWRLFEVVHDRLESVATERLTTAAGLEPPVDPTFSYESMTTVIPNGRCWMALARKPWSSSRTRNARRLAKRRVLGGKRNHEWTGRGWSTSPVRRPSPTPRQMAAAMCSCTVGPQIGPKRSVFAPTRNCCNFQPLR